MSGSVQFSIMIKRIDRLLRFVAFLQVFSGYLALKHITDADLDYHHIEWFAL